MSGLGIVFRIVVPDIEESPEPDESPADFAERAATDKAYRAAAIVVAEEGAKELLVIAGDTVVVVEGRILGKPRDPNDARAMLHTLSGKTHEVISGLCVLRAEGATPLNERSLSVTTQVTFRTLSEREIESYVATGEPLDKAGAYAVQGRARDMIDAVEGSYTNVVGLPMDELKAVLIEDFGLSLP